MSTAVLPGSFVPVDAETGKRVQARRLALGMSVKKLAELAGVDRGRLAKLEEGDQSIRPATLGAVESALRRLEHEMGMDEVRPVGDPSQGLVEFTVTGSHGVSAVVKGPVKDLEALQAAVAKLVAEMRDEGQGKSANP